MKSLLVECIPYIFEELAGGELADEELADEELAGGVYSLYICNVYDASKSPAMYILSCTHV